MLRNNERPAVRGLVALFLVLVNAAVLQLGYVAHAHWYKAAFLTIPPLAIALFAFYKKPGARV